MLIEGNVLKDAGIAEWLGSIAPRDAIACWLIGTHVAVHGNTALGFEDMTPLPYRFRVHLQLGGLARQILRPGGIMHLVDRVGVAANDAEHRGGLLAQYSELFSGASWLNVEAVELRPFHHQPDARKVQLERESGTEGEERASTSARS